MLGYGFQDVANIVWAFATLEFDPGEHVIAELHHRAMHQICIFSVQELANLLWATASLGHALPGSHCIEYLHAIESRIQVRHRIKDDCLHPWVYHRRRDAIALSPFVFLRFFAQTPSNSRKQGLLQQVRCGWVCAQLQFFLTFYILHAQCSEFCKSRRCLLLMNFSSSILCVVNIFEIKWGKLRTYQASLISVETSKTIW